MPSIRSSNGSHTADAISLTYPRGRARKRPKIIFFEDRRLGCVYKECELGRRSGKRDEGYSVAN